MRKPRTGILPDKLQLYDDLVATKASVKRKGQTTPYTSLNGHMFSFITSSGTLALRLPAEERQAFLKKYQTRLCEQHGTVLKEYVEVPDELLRKTKELKNIFARSLAYVEILKPKPTKSRIPATKKRAR